MFCYYISHHAYTDLNRKCIVSIDHLPVHSGSTMVIYLLLGDEGGALGVRGVVGEVVRERFHSIPRRITCDALWSLCKSGRR